MPLPKGVRQPVEDDVLVRQAREGDGRAVEELVLRHQRRVNAMAFSLCGFNAEEARDAVQEAFLQAFRNIRQFEGRSSFKTWLYRIVVNACRDVRRRNRRWYRFLLSPDRKQREEALEEISVESLPDVSGQADPFTQASQSRLTEDMKKALESLSDRQRTIFQLKVFEEMSIFEIGELTGMAEGTVKTHLFRATRALRSRLKDWIDR